MGVDGVGVSDWVLDVGRLSLNLSLSHTHTLSLSLSLSLFLPLRSTPVFFHVLLTDQYGHARSHDERHAVHSHHGPKCVCSIAQRHEIRTIRQGDTGRGETLGQDRGRVHVQEGRTEGEVQKNHHDGADVAPKG